MTPDPFAEGLARLRSAGLLRELRAVASDTGGEIEFTGSRLVNFASNDYLGLSRHPAVTAAAAEALARYGTGSGASRLITGTRPPHRLLEEKLAAFKNAEAALAFSSGYAAAVGVIPALAGPDDVIITDKLAHACLIDGIRLSGAAVRVFPHNHLGRLESHLRWARQRAPRGRALIVTESVFSMDGDAAPLREIVSLKNHFGAMLLLDEAHATGLLGPDGRGLAAALGIEEQIEIRMGTLSKALGVSGGFVAGSRSLISWLVNRARSFIFSTAPPPLVAAAACAALDLVTSPEGGKLRETLAARVSRLESALPSRFRRVNGAGAIFPLVIGPEHAALEAAAAARENGLFVPAVRYPTVPKGRARLRATLAAFHSEDQVDRLAAFTRSLAAALPDPDTSAPAA